MKKYEVFPQPCNVASELENKQSKTKQGECFGTSNRGPTSKSKRVRSLPFQRTPPPLGKTLGVMAPKSEMKEVE